MLKFNEQGVFVFGTLLMWSVPFVYLLPSFRLLTKLYWTINNKLEVIAMGSFPRSLIPPNSGNHYI